MTAVPSTRSIIDAAGTTYCEQAGFTLRDRPAALFQLVVLSALLAKPIDSGLAVDAARELRRVGVTSPRSTLNTTWQQRVDALGRAHYRRFDESMATRVAEAAQFVLDEYSGDLRRLAARAGQSIGVTRDLLIDAPGIGPAGADIFLREAQRVWPWAAPYLDDRVRAGARRLGLSVTSSALRRRFAGTDPAALAAALVRVSLDDDLATRLGGR